MGKIAVSRKPNITRQRNVLSKYSIFIIVVIMFGISSLLNENFLSVVNLTNILRQISVTTILAFGETMLIICGLLDLASGAVLALAGVLAVFVFQQTGSLILAFAVGIGMGLIFNIMSGTLVSVYKTPPFIATLAITTIARGAVLLFTKGQNIYEIGRFNVFGQGSFGFVPIPVIVMFLMLVLTWYILNNH